MSVTNHHVAGVRTDMVLAWILGTHTFPIVLNVDLYMAAPAPAPAMKAAVVATKAAPMKAAAGGQGAWGKAVAAATKKIPNDSEEMVKLAKRLYGAERKKKSAPAVPAMKAMKAMK